MVHLMQIAKWRKGMPEELLEAFADGRTLRRQNEDAERDELYEGIDAAALDAFTLPSGSQLWVDGNTEESLKP